MSLQSLTAEAFDNVLKETEGLLVVDFYAVWCGPCRVLAPVIEEAAEEMPEVSFWKVDVDQAPELASRYKILSIPTLGFFRNGELLKKSIGAISYEELEEIIQGL